LAHVKNAITFAPTDGRLLGNLKVMEAAVSPTDEAKNAA